MIQRLFILFLSLFVFGITQAQVIQLRKPAKGDVWPAFTVQRIQWTSTNIDNIKIESSLDSGKTWNVILASYPASAEYYDWEVPNKVSDSCFIRVTDVANPGTFSTNFPANPFIIPKPGLTLDSIPAKVFGRSVLPIPWTHSGIKKVNVYLSYTGRSQFVKIADTISANNGFFIWIVKDTTASTCYIRVEDASNPSIADTSDQAFAIQPLPRAVATKYNGGIYDGHASASSLARSLRVISPNVKDSLIGSTVYTIRWDARNVNQIKLEYTINNGGSWSTIQSSIPASAGQYDWKVPNMPTSSGRVRILDVSDTTFMDSSDSLFTIRKKELKLVYPTASDKLTKGSVWPIAWSAMGVSKVRLRYLPSGKIADTVSATNEMFNWVAGSVPDSFRIVIQDLEDSVLADTSGFFKPVSLPGFDRAKYRGGKYDGHSTSSNIRSSIQISYPSRKISLTAGSTLSIQWRSVNVDNMSLWLSTDSLKTWSLREAAITASTSTYTVRLPNITANFCFVKLVSVSDSLVFDISDSSFSLIPKQLKNTTDTANWVVGYPKMISWESVGIDSLSISYRTAQNGAWTILNKSYAANAEAMYWILPSAFDSLWLRLQDATDTSLSQVNSYHKRFSSTTLVSNGTKYKGGKFDGHSFRSNVNKIIIRKPDANEVVVSGSVYSINWATINVTDSVMLQFSVDSGKTWIQIGRVSAVNGLYSWQVPVTLPSGGTITGSTTGPVTVESGEINSSKCLLRAVDQANANEVVGMSTKTFTIKASSSKLTNTVVFNKPSDMVWPGGTSQVLKATSTSGRNIKYLVISGAAAQVSTDTLIAVKAGKVTIGALSLGDSSYLPSDTIKYTICVNPAKPVITVKDSKVSFCAGDSAFISAPVGFSYKWNSGDTLQQVVVKSSKKMTVQVSVEGCFSVQSDTVTLSSDTIAKPIVADTSTCSGSAAPGLKATALSGNALKWYGTNATGGSASSTAPVASSTSVGVVNYYVSQVNARGCESDRAKLVFTVHALPAKPTITWKDSVLTIPASYTTYKWLLNNTAVTGAASNTLRPTSSGNFRVVVTNAAGCSDTSDTYTFSVTSISIPMLDGKVIKLYPNPVSQRAILDLGRTPTQPVQLKLYTVQGVLLRSWSVKERKSEIGISSFPSGEYLIEVISGRGKTVLRLVKAE